ILSQLKTSFTAPSPDERFMHSVPFVVTLTFEEQKSAVEKILETLKEIYPKLGELALRAAPAVLAGGPAAAAAAVALRLSEFVNDFSAQHAKDVATQALSKAIPQTEDDTIPYDKIANDIKNWKSTAGGQPFKNSKIEDRDVKAFFVTIRD